MFPIMDDFTPHITPIVAISGYLAYPKHLRINPALLYRISVIHNGALVLFSAWTFASLANILYNEGIVFKSNYYLKMNYSNIILT